MKVGDSVAGWTLAKILGKGGNADVWLGQRSAERCAIKVPHSQKIGREPFERFRSEITLLQRLSDSSRVLPLIDANPDPTVGIVFHATPVAETLETWLESNPDFDEILSAVADVAQALAELAAQGVFHRDIKPSNIFLLDGRWVLGDLGLATFPDKAALTEEGRKLGPVYYLAPEMLGRPTEADPGPADVFSLAKTVWVACTGQKYPIQGEHQISHAPVQVGTWVVHAVTPTLDRVLARATSLDPTARPSMAEFAGELSEISRVDATVPTDLSPSPGLRVRLRALSSTVEERRLAREKLEEQLEAERMALGEWLDPVAGLLAEVVDYDVSRGSGRGREKDRSEDKPETIGNYVDHVVHFSVPVPGQQWLGIEVHLRVQSTVEGNQEVELSGVLSDKSEKELIFEASDQFATGSPLREQVRRRVSEELGEGLNALLDEFGRRMEAYTRE